MTLKISRVLYNLQILYRNSILAEFLRKSFRRAFSPLCQLSFRGARDRSQLHRKNISALPNNNNPRRDSEARKEPSFRSSGDKFSPLSLFFFFFFSRYHYRRAFIVSFSRRVANHRAHISHRSPISRPCIRGIGIKSRALFFRTMPLAGHSQRIRIKSRARHAGVCARMCVCRRGPQGVSRLDVVRRACAIRHRDVLVPCVLEGLREFKAPTSATSRDASPMRAMKRGEGGISPFLAMFFNATRIYLTSRSRNRSNSRDEFGTY